MTLCFLCWVSCISSRSSSFFGRAGGPGIRSPTHARAPMGWRAIVSSSTPFLAHPLCGKRKWGLRPDTQTTCPAASLVRHEKPTRSSRWTVGFAGAGPIRGGLPGGQPDTVLTQQPRQVKGRRPRAWAGERKPRRPPARCRHDPCPRLFDHLSIRKGATIGRQAGGPGIRSPAHARAPMGWLAGIASSTLWLA